jgi:hypothetical protein
LAELAGAASAPGGAADEPLDGFGGVTAGVPAPRHAATPRTTIARESGSPPVGRRPQSESGSPPVGRRPQSESGSPPLGRRPQFESRRRICGEQRTTSSLEQDLTSTAAQR